MNISTRNGPYKTRNGLLSAWISHRLHENHTATKMIRPRSSSIMQWTSLSEEIWIKEISRSCLGMRRTIVTRNCSKKTGRNLKSSTRKNSNSNISLVSKRISEIELNLKLFVSSHISLTILYLQIIIWPRVTSFPAACSTSARKKC